MSQTRRNKVITKLAAKTTRMEEMAKKNSELAAKLELTQSDLAVTFAELAEVKAELKMAEGELEATNAQKAELTTKFDATVKELDGIKSDLMVAMTKSAIEAAAAEAELASEEIYGPSDEKSYKPSTVSERDDAEREERVAEKYKE